MIQQFPLIYHPYQYKNQLKGEKEELKVWQDKIERVTTFDHETIYFRDIEEMHISPTLAEFGQKIVITTSDNTLEIQGLPDIQKLWNTLSSLINPILAEKIYQRLKQEDIHFHEPLKNYRHWAMAGGFVLFCDLTTLISMSYLSWIKGDWSWGLFKVALYAVIIPLGSMALITPYLFLRKGGLILSQTGVRRPGEPPEQETGWEDISRVYFQKNMLCLQAPKTTYRLSSNARNFGVFQYLLDHYLLG